MGGLRGLGRLGGLRRVGVRAAQAIMGQVGRVGQVGQVGQVSIKNVNLLKKWKFLVIKYICEEQWSVEQIVGYCRKNGIPIFFAHSYSSWEQGLSEHTNGLVRQYIPKETDFKDVTNQEIKKYQYKINNRPRKVLDFQKPKDLFYQKVIWKIALDGGMGDWQNSHW